MFVFVFIRAFRFPRSVNCATAGLNEGKRLSGEAPLPDSDLGFRRFCQKSSRLGKNKVFRRQKEICFGVRRPLFPTGRNGDSDGKRNGFAYSRIWPSPRMTYL